MSRLLCWKKSISSLSLAVLLSSIALLCLEVTACAQDVWEYSPYRVKVWVSVSPTLSLSDESEREIHRQIAEYAELNFGPTWAIQVESTPDALFGSVLYRLDELTADQLLARELILVVGKSDEAKAAFLIMNPPPPKPPEDPKAPKKKRTKEEIENMADLEARAASLQSVRTLEAAIQKIKHIAIQPLQYSGMKRDIVPFLDKKQWLDFKEIVKPFQGTNEELQNQLASGKTIGALVQKQDLEKFKKVARPLPTRLPWQPEALLRDNDKIFLASVDKVGESIRIQVKELDSFVRRMGEIASADVVCKQDIARTVADLAKVAFSPIVRIEETDFKTAVLRVKATGLLTKEDHPIRVLPGDVLLPIIRRDDPNGNPTVLQTIPFTYIAITEKIDSVSRLYGAIFTASRGALSTAKNRRTQRVALKVNPSHPETNIKLGMQRVPDSSFVGAEIYRRTPGSEDLEMVGRTDWRGILTIGVSDRPTIQYDPPSESKTQAISNARKLAPDPVAPPEYKLVDDPVATNAASTASDQSLAAVKEPSKSSGGDDSDESQKKADSPKAPEIPKKARGFIQINAPLYLYYVKNGSTLLARLPIVNGMKSIEQADLPDDRRRLETEGLLKGMQSEVLDIVIRRKVLESRIKQEIAKKDLVKAEKLLDELKRVKSFEKMSEQVESIQRRALSTEKGPLLSGVVKRIESMLDVTRQLMQKYLQDTLVRTLETEIINSK
jgi:hypothetical protein